MGAGGCVYSTRAFKGGVPSPLVQRGTRLYLKALGVPAPLNNPNLLENGLLPPLPWPHVLNR